MKYPLGTVLLEKSGKGWKPRPVIVVECPEEFQGNDPPFPNLRDRQWGMYFESNGYWGGPWHGDPGTFIRHPDPDIIWRLWAKHCAQELVK